jgi:MFS family permease
MARAAVAGFVKSWPYWPVVSHPALRRVLPGVAVSSLGDGMGIVAVAWLALRLAPGPAQGLWVSAAVAAYSLPGVAGALLLSRLLARRGGARLAGWNAALRAGGLGAAALAAAAGVLTPAGYVALLAASSLLGVWGSAGKVTLVAETLPDEHRLAGNAMFSMLGTTGYIAGPAIAGLLVAVGGPALVIGIDAITFGVLAVSYLVALPAVKRAGARATMTTPAASAAGPRPAGFRVIGANRQLLALTAVTFAFYLVYGPVDVALPVHVHRDLHASAAVLGAFWTLFAVGEVIGGLAAAHLRRWRLWPIVTGIIAGWGLCLLPAGASGSLGLALAGFGVGGLIYAPFPATEATLFQRISPPGALTSVLAAQGAITLLAPSIGEVLGGPLVTAVGARRTLLLSAAVTLALGAVTAAVTAGNAVMRRSSPGRAGAAPGSASGARTPTGTGHGHRGERG